MNYPNRATAISEGRVLYQVASAIAPTDAKAGLTALHLTGRVEQVLGEARRLEAQENRALREAAAAGQDVDPDGWCVWCSTALATRWIEMQGQPRGVCQSCYAELNRGR